jgi:hypothetical protein
LHGYAGTAAPSVAGPGSVADSASVFDAGSAIDGASEAPSSMSSAAGAGGHDEDLSVDTRYAAGLLQGQLQPVCAPQHITQDAPVARCGTACISSANLAT